MSLDAFADESVGGSAATKVGKLDESTDWLSLQASTALPPRTSPAEIRGITGLRGLSAIDRELSTGLCGLIFHHSGRAWNSASSSAGHDGGGHAKPESQPARWTRRTSHPAKELVDDHGTLGR